MKTTNLLLCFMLCWASLGFAQTSIDAAFTKDANIVYFIKGDKVVEFDNTNNKVIKTTTLKQAFPGIPFASVDAALDYGNDKVYFFSGSQYVRFDLKLNAVDANYPKTTSQYWEGVSFGKIDAALDYGNGKVYFFSGTQYSRYDKKNEKIDENYPKTISQQTWAGVGFSSIDADLRMGNKVYFFKGNQYSRFDISADAADEGYPKNLDPWNGLEAALKGGSNPNPNPPDPTPTKGMTFFSGTWAEALAQSRETGKLIFVDAYATWCGPCKAMAANVFTDGSVGAFYNKNFINFKMDCEKGDGIPFSRKYGVTAYPTLYFIDANGKAVKTAIGGRDIEGFLQLGKEVIQSNGGGNGGNNGNGGNGNNNGGTIIKGYGSYNIQQKEIDLSPYKANSPNTVLAEFMFVKGINGTNFLGFQQENEAIILKINNNGERIGSPILLGKYWLSDLYPMSDGSLAVLVGKSINNTYLGDYPNAIQLIKISSTGSVGTAKHLFGGEGHGAQKSWFDGRSKGKISCNGSNFGIYFEVQKNWAEAGSADDIHNGDMFVVTDLNGNIDNSKTHFWTASHSNCVQVAPVSSGEFYTMTIGDAHPFGLQVYNRDKTTSFVAWPPKEDFVPYSECKSSSAPGILHFMAEDKGELIAIMGTLDHPNIGWDTKVDPLFLKFDKQGNVTKKKYLKVSPEDEGNISVHPLDGNYLVAYGKGNDYDNGWAAGNFEVTIIDGNANTVLAPTKIAKPFGSNSQLVPVSSKKFVWLNAPYDGVSKLEWYEMVFE